MIAHNINLKIIIIITTILIFHQCNKQEASSNDEKLGNVENECNVTTCDNQKCYCKDGPKISSNNETLSSTTNHYIINNGYTTALEDAVYEKLNKDESFTELK